MAVVVEASRTLVPPTNIVLGRDWSYRLPLQFCFGTSPGEQKYHPSTMTRVSTAASVPPILHTSTARALRKTRRHLSPSLAEASSQSISLQLRESWKEEEDAGQQFLFSPFQARWPSEKKIHELREKSVHFQSLHIAVCRQAAPVAKFADGCCIRLASSGTLSAIFTSSHVRVGARHDRDPRIRCCSRNC